MRLKTILQIGPFIRSLINKSFPRIVKLKSLKIANFLMTANSQVIPQRTNWPNQGLWDKVVCSTDTVVCAWTVSSKSDVDVLIPLGAGRWGLQELSRFLPTLFFVILLRIPFSSLVSFASKTSIIYSTTAPQTSSSHRQASSYFSRAMIPCVSEVFLMILPADIIAVLTELHIVGGEEGAGRWDCRSVVSNSNIGHPALIL